MSKIKLKGLKNARDLGGILNRDGKTLKEHCFLRSEQLCGLKAEDQSILFGRYGLRTVIDLRTDVERSDDPDIDMQGVKNIHIPVFSQEVIGITHENNDDKRKMLDCLPDMKELYKTIVTDDKCVGQLRKIFEVITDENRSGAILWHCTEGKDRCGLTSALFLSMLDVARETIEADYLLTNIAAEKKADKLAFLVKYVAKQPEKAETVRDIFLAKKEYFDAAFDAIDETYGSMDNFLRQRLGITDDVKESMKRRFLI